MKHIFSAYWFGCVCDRFHNPPAGIVRRCTCPPSMCRCCHRCSPQTQHIWHIVYTRYIHKRICIILLCILHVCIVIVCLLASIVYLYARPVRRRSSYVMSTCTVQTQNTHTHQTITYSILVMLVGAPRAYIKRTIWLAGTCERHAERGCAV